MGETAMAAVLRRLEGEDGDARRVVLRPTLVERGTTARPGGVLTPAAGTDARPVRRRPDRV
jgi:hypothetical protein